MYKLLYVNIAKSSHFTGARLVHSRRYHSNRSQLATNCNTKKILDDIPEVNEQENSYVENPMPSSSKDLAAVSITPKLSTYKMEKPQTRTAMHVVKDYSKFYAGNCTISNLSSSNISKRNHHVYSIFNLSGTKRFLSHFSLRKNMTDNAKENYRRALRDLYDIQASKSKFQFKSQNMCLNPGFIVEESIAKSEKRKNRATKLDITYPTHTFKHNWALSKRFRIREGGSDQKAFELNTEDKFKIRKKIMKKKFSPKVITYPTMVKPLKKNRLPLEAFLKKETPEKKVEIKLPQQKIVAVKGSLDVSCDLENDSHDCDKIEKEFNLLIKNHPTIENASNEAKMKLKAKFIQLLLKSARSSTCTDLSNKESLNSDAQELQKVRDELKHMVDVVKDIEEPQETVSHIPMHPSVETAPNNQLKETYSKRVWTNDTNKDELNVDDVCVKERADSGLIIKDFVKERTPATYENHEEEAPKLSNAVTKIQSSPEENMDKLKLERENLMKQLENLDMKFSAKTGEKIKKILKRDFNLQEQKASRLTTEKVSYKEPLSSRPKITLKTKNQPWTEKSRQDSTKTSLYHTKKKDSSDGDSINREINGKTINKEQNDTNQLSEKVQNHMLAMTSSLRNRLEEPTKVEALNEAARLRTAISLKQRRQEEKRKEFEAMKNKIHLLPSNKVQDVTPRIDKTLDRLKEKIEIAKLSKKKIEDMTAQLRPEIKKKIVNKKMAIDNAANVETMKNDGRIREPSENKRKSEEKSVHLYNDSQIHDDKRKLEQEQKDKQEQLEKNEIFKKQIEICIPLRKLEIKKHIHLVSDETDKNNFTEIKKEETDKNEEIKRSQKVQHGCTHSPISNENSEATEKKGVVACKNNIFLKSLKISSKTILPQDKFDDIVNERLIIDDITEMENLEEDLSKNICLESEGAVLKSGDEIFFVQDKDEKKDNILTAPTLSTYDSWNNKLSVDDNAMLVDTNNEIDEVIKKINDLKLMFKTQHSDIMDQKSLDNKRIPPQQQVPTEKDKKENTDKLKELKHAILRPIVHCSNRDKDSKNGNLQVINFGQIKKEVCACPDYASELNNQELDKKIHTYFGKKYCMEQNAKSCSKTDLEALKLVKEKNVVSPAGKQFQDNYKKLVKSLQNRPSSCSSVTIEMEKDEDLAKKTSNNRRSSSWPAKNSSKIKLQAVESKTKYSSWSSQNYKSFAKSVTTVKRMTTSKSENVLKKVTAESSVKTDDPPKIKTNTVKQKKKPLSSSCMVNENLRQKDPIGILHIILPKKGSLSSTKNTQNNFVRNEKSEVTCEKIERPANITAPSAKTPNEKQKKLSETKKKRAIFQILQDGEIFIIKKSEDIHKQASPEHSKTENVPINEEAESNSNFAGENDDSGYCTKKVVATVQQIQVKPDKKQLRFEVDLPNLLESRHEIDSHKAKIETIFDKNGSLRFREEQKLHRFNKFLISKRRSSDDFHTSSVKETLSNKNCGQMVDKQLENKIRNIEKELVKRRRNMELKCKQINKITGILGAKVIPKIEQGAIVKASSYGNIVRRLTKSKIDEKQEKVSETQMTNEITIGCNHNNAGNTKCSNVPHKIITVDLHKRSLYCLKEAKNDTPQKKLKIVEKSPETILKKQSMYTIEESKEGDIAMMKPQTLNSKLEKESLYTLKDSAENADVKLATSVLQNMSTKLNELNTPLINTMDSKIHKQPLTKNEKIVSKKSAKPEKPYESIHNPEQKLLNTPMQYENLVQMKQQMAPIRTEELELTEKNQDLVVKIVSADRLGEEIKIWSSKIFNTKWSQNMQDSIRQQSEKGNSDSKTKKEITEIAPKADDLSGINALECKSGDLRKEVYKQRRKHDTIQQNHRSKKEKVEELNKVAKQLLKKQERNKWEDPGLRSKNDGKLIHNVAKDDERPISKAEFLKQQRQKKRQKLNDYIKPKKNSQEVIVLEDLSKKEQSKRQKETDGEPFKRSSNSLDITNLIKKQQSVKAIKQQDKKQKKTDDEPLKASHNSLDLENSIKKKQSVKAIEQQDNYEIKLPPKVLTNLEKADKNKERLKNDEIESPYHHSKESIDFKNLNNEIEKYFQKRCASSKSTNEIKPILTKKCTLPEKVQQECKHILKNDSRYPQLSSEILDFKITQMATLITKNLKLVETETPTKIGKRTKSLSEADCAFEHKTEIEKMIELKRKNKMKRRRLLKMESKEKLTSNMSIDKQESWNKSNIVKEETFSLTLLPQLKKQAQKTSCKKLFLPLKRPQQDNGKCLESTTLDIPVKELVPGEHLNIEKKILPLIPEKKYHQLENAYATKENFLPMVKKFEGVEVTEEEKNKIINFRFELLKKLNEEFSKQLKQENVKNEINLTDAKNYLDKDMNRIRITVKKNIIKKKNKGDLMGPFKPLSPDEDVKNGPRWYSTNFDNGNNNDNSDRHLEAKQKETSDTMNNKLSSVNDCDNPNVEEEGCSNDFDIKEAVPEAFECPSSQLEESLRENLYYQYHKSSFADLNQFLAQKRTYSNNEKVDSSNEECK
ncbi:hypothetical protein ABEB36_014332 [Hypothenemus hampei]|uniref:Uncharacterized protein n=1 Tax=Hypothenemus hampei TaxID=57062 RepID=A0ABD1E684_HYPHA